MTKDDVIAKIVRRLQLSSNEQVVKAYNSIFDKPQDFKIKMKEVVEFELTVS